jgi:hypothetical protein
MEAPFPWFTAVLRGTGRDDNDERGLTGVNELSALSADEHVNDWADKCTDDQGDDCTKD